MEEVDRLSKHLYVHKTILSFFIKKWQGRQQIDLILWYFYKTLPLAEAYVSINGQYVDFFPLHKRSLSLMVICWMIKLQIMLKAEAKIHKSNLIYTHLSFNFKSCTSDQSLVSITQVGTYIWFQRKTLAGLQFYFAFYVGSQLSISLFVHMCI